MTAMCRCAHGEDSAVSSLIVWNLEPFVIEHMFDNFLSDDELFRKIPSVFCVR